MFADLLLEKSIQGCGVNRVDGLCVDDVWHATIILEQVDGHIPLPTISEKRCVRGEVRDEPGIEGQIGVLHHKLEVVIGFVEFVVEEQIGLSRN